MNGAVTPKSSTWSRGRRKRDRTEEREEQDWGFKTSLPRPGPQGSCPLPRPHIQTYKRVHTHARTRTPAPRPAGGPLAAKGARRCGGRGAESSVEVAWLLLRLPQENGDPHPAGQLAAAPRTPSPPPTHPDDEAVAQLQLGLRKRLRLLHGRR